MHRRTLLGVVGTTSLLTVSGCLSAGTGDDDPTETPMLSVTDTTFTVVESRSGTQVDEATVTLSDGTVTVEGMIWGADGCTTARLDSVDHDEGELTVAVATVDQTETTTADDVGLCTQALVEIAYRVTVTFEGRRPATVVVTHDHGDGPTSVTTVSS